MKIFLLTLFLAFGCSDNNGKSERSNPYSTDEEYQHVENFLDLVNSHRTSKGLKPFIHSTDIEFQAQNHSLRMARGEIDFGHEDFGQRCLRIKERHQSGNLCAENVARYHKSALAVLNAWLASPAHAKNINSDRLTHSGVGLSINAQGEYYWTQLFLEVK